MPRNYRRKVVTDTEGSGMGRRKREKGRGGEIYSVGRVGDEAWSEVSQEMPLV